MQDAILLINVKIENVAICGIAKCLIFMSLVAKHTVVDGALQSIP